VTPDEARKLLGVARQTEWELVRRSYRSRIRAAHPDVVGGSAAEAADLNIAFAALVRERRAGGSVDVPEHQTLTNDVNLVGDDTLIVDAPPDETFGRVLVALDLIGEVSYVDRTGPIAEAIVVLDDGTSHSLVVSFQGRGLGTEVFATLESIERVSSVPPHQVLRTLVRFIPPA